MEIVVGIVIGAALVLLALTIERNLFEKGE